MSNQGHPGIFIYIAGTLDNKTFLMPGVNDAILLQELRSLRTREAAFKVLYDNYFSSVVKLAFTIVKDFRVAQDIGQEVFLDFWRLRPFEKKDISSFFSYFMTSCQNACFDYLKKRKKELAVEQHILQTSEVQETEDGTKGDSIRLLVYLTRQQQQVVRHVALNGRSHADTASLLGISLETVRVHWKNAKKILRKTADRWHF